MNPADEPPTVEVTDSTVTREAIIRDAPPLEPSHLARLRSAAVIIVPYPGRGTYKGPLFFGTAPELLSHFEENLFAAEIPVRDEDYKQLALHADTIWLGLLWTHREQALALVRLIGAWLVATHGKYLKAKRVEVEVVVQGTKGSKQVSYKGSADAFEKTMKTAVEGLNDLDSP